MKKSLFAVGTLGALLLVAPHAQAQTTSPVCPQFVYNMRVGSLDSTTNGQVSLLQNSLVTAGVFNKENLGTGRFGPITLSAVIAFQRSRGLPTTGYVGPLTRQALGRLNCSPVAGPVTISYVTPTQADVGTTVTITGFALTSKNAVLLDGATIASDIAAQSGVAITCTTDPSCHSGIRQTLTFTVPSSYTPYCKPGYMCAQYLRVLTPGYYSLTVSNENGTSNPVSFRVTEGTNNQTLSIQGLDAPSTLSMTQSGTWTVRVLTTSTSGTLHYSVIWGDEVQTATAAGIRAPDAQIFSTSATFSHTYSRAGTYTPTFTVTDDQGRSANASATVVVTPIY